MAHVDYFLKIDTIEGESQDHKHKSEIPLESWSWGETNSGSFHHGQGGGAGKVVMQDFHFQKNVDKSSPKLMLACATGQHIKSAILTCRKAGKEQQEYLIVKFHDLLISSYQTGGSQGANHLPTDQISFNYTKVEIEYKEQKQDGTLGSPVKVGYDLKQQKAS
jgi:type VI secretion system secreted protein Hcp